MADVITIVRLAGLRSVSVVGGGVVLGMVIYQDLIRAFARDDQDIGADVRRRVGVE